MHTIALAGELDLSAVNGEGSDSPPDQISTIPVNPGGETCENSTLLPNRPVE